ncbi:MAG: macro domain-containing protein [Ruminococcus sp.]
MIALYYSDIAFAEADIIVNAANGCGWMSNCHGWNTLHRSVSESLNDYTEGKIEKESRLRARKNLKISAWLYGTKPGDIFVTGSCGLKCKEIIHAVTMRYPGSKSKYESIPAVIEKIFAYCHENSYKSIAIPTLGCEAGGLRIMDVIRLIDNCARQAPDEMMIAIYAENPSYKYYYNEELSLWSGIRSEIQRKANFSKGNSYFSKEK